MKIYTNFDLTNYNSYRLEATCKTAYFPESESDLIGLYKNKKNYILLGNGYNVILSKASYNEDFVLFNGNFNTVSVDRESQIISAEAGATTLDVSLEAEKHSLTGVEFYFDIPSSIGGAVVMNAGTKEGETKNILLKVRYLDLSDMTVKEKNKNELEFEYRNSLFQKSKDKIILKAWFKLKQGNSQEIRKVMEESKVRRWAKQPREYPNCGSVYKRPPGRFVGPMIDELGLKGYRVGGAEISQKHSGFIVNIGNATGKDILAIIKHTKEKVLGKFGVELEVEQRVI